MVKQESERDANAPSGVEVGAGMEGARALPLMDADADTDYGDAGGCADPDAAADSHANNAMVS